MNKWSIHDPQITETAAKLFAGHEMKGGGPILHFKIKPDQQKSAVQNRIYAGRKPNLPAHARFTICSVPTKCLGDIGERISFGVRL